MFSVEACKLFLFLLLDSIYIYLFIYYINGHVFLAFLNVMYTIKNKIIAYSFTLIQLKKQHFY
jgi:hypothetical protein